MNKYYNKYGYNNKCDTCNCNPCNCGKIAPNDVYLLSTSTTTTIPGPIGPAGSTPTKAEFDIVVNRLNELVTNMQAKILNS